MTLGRTTCSAAPVGLVHVGRPPVPGHATRASLIHPWRTSHSPALTSALGQKLTFPESGTCPSLAKAQEAPPQPAQSQRPSVQDPLGFPVKAGGTAFLARERRLGKIVGNNTPHASRQIGAPWGVTFFRPLRWAEGIPGTAAPGCDGDAA